MKQKLCISLALKHEQHGTEQKHAWSLNKKLNMKYTYNYIRSSKMRHFGVALFLFWSFISPVRTKNISLLKKKKKKKKKT